MRRGVLKRHNRYKYTIKLNFNNAANLAIVPLFPLWHPSPRVRRVQSNCGNINSWRDQQCLRSIPKELRFGYVPEFGRRDGLMVSALVSGSSGLGSSPARGHYVVLLGKTTTLTVPLSTQVYKWVPANLMLGVTLRWTSVPSRGK